MRLEKQGGYTESVIDENCDATEFASLTNFLTKHLKINFLSKLDSGESSYWDFIYNEARLTVHFNLFAGISIFPSSLSQATKSDNEVVKNASWGLIEYLENKKAPLGFLGECFNEIPIQWGFRGDPFLWYELREKTKKIALPSTIGNSAG